MATPCIAHLITLLLEFTFLLVVIEPTFAADCVDEDFVVIQRCVVAFTDFFAPVTAIPSPPVREDDLLLVMLFIAEGNAVIARMGLLLFLMIRSGITSLLHFILLAFDLSFVSSHVINISWDSSVNRHLSPPHPLASAAE